MKMRIVVKSHTDCF